MHVVRPMLAVAAEAQEPVLTLPVDIKKTVWPTRGVGQIGVNHTKGRSWSGLKYLTYDSPGFA